MDRRTLLVSGGVVATAAVASACSSPDGQAAAAVVQSQAPAAGQIATVGEIPVGGGMIIAEPAIVITQPEQGVIKAFTAICTHQGCLVGEVQDNQIICPCHGARFSAVDGAVEKGPAEEPLAELPVVLNGDGIVVG